MFADSYLAVAEVLHRRLRRAEPYYPILEALRGCAKAASGLKSPMHSRSSHLMQAQIPEHASLEQRSKLPDQVAADAKSRMVREACGLFEAPQAQR